MTLFPAHALLKFAVPLVELVVLVCVTQFIGVTAPRAVLSLVVVMHLRVLD
ncbi:MAG: hypothetical protein UU74_C0044G0011 [Candidatus Woesebacteria bacterium GW2011_GWA1_41_7]|uniref:Uncharacterized protein n=1 Tax=Candidatus Woesebacteria bacterium GW2011_GWA1_41_7 TaxID=1618556 RepID=A0A0G0WUB8_9BACT|nr:MAG: hypothetical protein UU74_C0044G0011 [Candidatus Woesebacteria bacterium GW2011_GWA1_41_7]